MFQWEHFNRGSRRKIRFCFAYHETSGNAAKFSDGRDGQHQAQFKFCRKRDFRSSSIFSGRDCSLPIKTMYVRACMCACVFTHVCV